MPAGLPSHHTSGNINTEVVAELDITIAENCCWDVVIAVCQCQGSSGLMPHNHIVYSNTICFPVQLYLPQVHWGDIPDTYLVPISSIVGKEVWYGYT